MDKDRLIYIKKLLEQEKIGRGKSMLRRLAYDIDSFNSLVCLLDNHDLEMESIPEKKDNYFMYKVMNNLDYLEQIADCIIDFYKDIDFYYYQNRPDLKLSSKEKKEIFSDFLKQFSNDAYLVYKDLYNEKRIFFSDLGNELGESFILSELDEYFIALSGDNNNDLLEIETYIHELMHVYSHKFLKNYSWNHSKNTLNGFYLETIPLFSEIAFYNWLESVGFSKNDLLFHINLNDFVNLRFYKTIKYLSQISLRDDAFVVCDNINYKVYGNNDLDIDQGIPFYGYSESYKSGGLNNFQYGMGLIDAYSLLERKINGEDTSKLINEYLLTLQNPFKFYSDIMRGYDVTFMRDTVLKHNSELKELVPVVGYKYEKKQ